MINASSVFGNLVELPYLPINFISNSTNLGLSIIITIFFVIYIKIK